MRSTGTPTNTATRPPLTANAAFSLATGALIAAAPGTVGDWLGVEISGWLRLLGLALIGHALILFWAIRRPDPTPWARINLLAIAPYPLLMIVLVATSVIGRPFGQVLALLDGAVVAAIAAWHWVSLRNPAPLHQPQHA